MAQSHSHLSEKRYVLVLALMGSYSIQSLLITASKEAGDFEYDIAVTVFLAEFLKLLFGLSQLLSEANWELKLDLRYVFPSACYMIQNQLVFVALRFLSPPEYQMLNNGKLFTTSLVYRVVMKRSLRVVQWLALALLGIGMALGNSPSTCIGAPASAQLWTGTCLMVVIAWLSAAAGVSNEWLIKQSQSVHQANVWLYGYGCIASLLQLALSGGTLTNVLRFKGFTLTTWLIVLCNAVLGQSIAYIMRYADSIVKIYAVSASMIFTTLLSVIFFNYKITFQMVMGYLTCLVSWCMFYCPPEMLTSLDHEAASSLCSSRASSFNGSSPGSTSTATEVEGSGQPKVKGAKES